MKYIVWKSHTKQAGTKFLVPKGHKLVVEAGVFIDYESIIVQGKLVFKGTTTAPIICNAVIKSIDHFKKISLKAEYAHFNNRIEIRSNSQLSHCVINDNFYVRSGQTIIESSEVKDASLSLSGSDNMVNSTEFINCRGLSFYSNLVFTNNIIRVTNNNQRTKQLNLTSIKKDAAVKLHIGAIKNKTIIIENNVFENLPVAISLHHKGYTYASSPAIRTLIIRLNEFYNNGVAILWSEDLIHAEVLHNNFWGDPAYHFAANPKTNTYGDKSKYNDCKIGANYFENEEVFIYDHQDDFTAAYCFNITKLLTEPITNKDRKQQSRSAIVRQSFYNQLPNFLERRFKNFLLCFGFLMTVMSFCALIQAVTMSRAINQPFSEGLYLITDRSMLLLYFSISVLFSVIYRHDTLREMFNR